jgi:penicillin-binding protein 1A
MRFDRLSRGVTLWVLPPLLAALIGGVAGVGFAAVIRMPRVDTLADFRPPLITRLLNAQGEVFSTFARERRVLIEDAEVPELLQQAVLAAEDANFLQHGGVDAQGVLRAILTNALRGRRAQGGSTITMQLARQLFLTPQKRWRRKIEEAFLAVELEKTYSKQQILALYCNLIFLGHGNYGMESAARDYFGKSVGELTLTEAATLAGIPQRPSSYSPYRRPDLVVSRRNYVLRRMREEGFIREEEMETAVAQPLGVVTRPPSRLFAPYFAEEVRKHLEAQYGSEAILDGGLVAETTLEPPIQRAAEEALRDHLLLLDHRRGWRGPIARAGVQELEGYELPAWEAIDTSFGAWNQGIVLSAGTDSAEVRIGDRVYTLDAAGIEWTGASRPDRLLRRGDIAWFEMRGIGAEGDPGRVALQQEPELEGAALVIESATGAVRAMVGGWSFARSKFNRATQAQRQLGSAFKPLVFAAALEMGYTPADTLFDAPVTFPSVPGQPPYSPRNFYRSYHGITTLRRALEDSINVTSVKLLALVGPEEVIDLARRCGISSTLYPYPSLALGAADLVPLEVAAAYATIANQGVYVQPYLIERVIDGDGTAIEEHQPSAHRAMSAEVAYVLTHMLEGVIDRGTGAAAAGLDLDLAGKTGTTDVYGDAWFVGFTPRYTLLSWVGYDVRRSLGRQGTGALAAMPIWQAIVERGLEEGWVSPGERFAPPPGVEFAEVEHGSGLLTAPGARVVVKEAFLAGTAPALRFRPDWNRVLSLPWYQQRSFYLPKAGEAMPEDVEDWELVRDGWEAKDDPQGAAAAAGGGD